jgi:hypothetical protein
MPEFNQRLYEESLDVLLTANVPRDIAEAASQVVATDDGTLPNLGRSAEDTEVCKTAMDYYWRGQRDEQ